MSELYRDYIDGKADEIINSLGGTITPAPANAELYRDFLDRKFDDVINAIDNVKVKTFTYTGTGSTLNTITFPSIPKIILKIQRKFTGDSHYDAFTDNILYNYNYRTLINYKGIGATVYSVAIATLTYNDNEMTLGTGGGSSGQSLNTNGVEYTVYYI